MKKKLSHLIIGYGQVGKGLELVLRKKYTIYTDPYKNNVIPQMIDVVHICFPYHKRFIWEVQTWSYIFKNSVVIVHSTVPVGTMDKINAKNAVYSPIRGKHPNLSGGIKTFVKYFAAHKNNPKYANLAAGLFNYTGVKTEIAKDYKDLELAKLLDTTAYGWNIIFMKEVERLCKELKCNFETVYTSFTKTYNSGYTKLGNPEYQRPVLKPIKGKIGGHCVVQNCHLLKKFSPAQIILKKNKSY